MRPEEVRALRGDLSRAAFAKQIGVAPLTVYRWELPDDAKEARRPRGKIKQRLQQLAMGDTRNDPGSQSYHEPIIGVAQPSGLTPYEREHLLPMFQEILNARWNAVETEVVKLLTSDRVTSSAGNALAQFALATIQFLGHNEVRGAYGTFSPILRDLERGAFCEEVAIIGHALAAMLFSAPDGQLFNIGRVNTHVASADRLLSRTHNPEVTGVLRVAEIWAAYHLGDYALFGRLLEKHDDDLKTVKEPVTRFLSNEIFALGSYLTGRTAEARRRYSDLSKNSEGIHFATAQKRCLAFHCLLKLGAGESPQQTLATIEDSEQNQEHVRLLPGYPDILLAAARGQALIRMARLSEAKTALDRALYITRTMRWTPVPLICTQVRLYYQAGWFDELQKLMEQYAAFGRSHRPLIVEAAASLVRGMVEVSRMNFVSAAEAFVTAQLRAGEADTLPDLRTYASVLAFQAWVLAGNDRRAHRALQWAESGLERHPSIWMTGFLTQYKALMAAQQGHLSEARQHVQVARSTFENAQDQPQIAYNYMVDALVSYLSDTPDAQQELADAEKHLKELGLPIPPTLRVEHVRRLSEDHKLKPLFSEPMPQPSSNAGITADNLAVLINRLSVRGMNDKHIYNELTELAHRLHEQRPCRLVELDTEGNQTTRASRGEFKVFTSEEYFEFGDGCGRRFRLGVAGPLAPEDRVMLRLLSTVAGRSLEVVALRELIGGGPSPAIHEDPPMLPGFVAVSESMKSLMREISQLNKSRANVLIRGESGSGKEVVARAIHALSVRSENSFVTFNCSTVPRELFEGQLFGHRKGSFTGATSDHQGVIPAANHGTLFLDEIGDLPLSVQPKLLRFLENAEVLPLGEAKPIEVDVRVIAATHQDLELMVREGTFREDLFYRLQVVPLSIPPLRERRTDILPLARHFIKQLLPKESHFPTLSLEAREKLLAHRWPGNVRELRNVIERCLAYSSGEKVLKPEHIRLA